jgi:hypothetical protein
MDDDSTDVAENTVLTATVQNQSLIPRPQKPLIKSGFWHIKDSKYVYFFLNYTFSRLINFMSEVIYCNTSKGGADGQENFS